MRKRMPSINALRAFETIMKRRSVKGAAEEISLTPQAVRYQIKMLEELIDDELFIRHGNSLEPTGKAVMLLSYITHSLDILEEGLNSLEEKGDNKLYLHVSPYYANNFLIPRLHEFTEQYPGIDLRISIGAENIDFEAKGIDIAIQWGYGHWNGFQAYPLVSDLKVLAATPQLLEKHLIERPADLTRHRLISPWVQNTLWEDVFDLLCVDFHDHVEYLYLHDNEAILKATLSGIGVGLVSRPEAVRAIAQRKLVAPLGVDLLTQLPHHKTPKFYLIRQNQKEASPLVERFTQWAQASVDYDATPNLVAK